MMFWWAKLWWIDCGFHKRNIMMESLVGKLWWIVSHLSLVKFVNWKLSFVEVPPPNIALYNSISYRLPSHTLGQVLRTSMIKSPHFSAQYISGLSLLTASMHVTLAFHDVRVVVQTASERHAVLYAATNSWISESLCNNTMNKNS